MPTDVFYWVLNMSISGSVAGLILLLLRRIKKIPRRIVYALWVVPFLRFVLPLSLSYEYSVAQLLKNVTGRIVTVYPGEYILSDRIELSMMNAVGVAYDYFPITYKNDSLRIIFECASDVWCIIAALVISIVVVAYVSAMRNVRKSTHIRDNIYVSENVKSPAVFGIIRPRIIFPIGAEIDGEHLALLHERVHIRRLDNLWRLVGVIVCAVHFFNPLAWVCLRCFLVDMELSADESVIRALDEDERADYARSLVDHVERGAVFSSAFGGAALRGRLENIINYKEMTKLSAVCVVLLAILLAVVLITNAI